MSGFNINIEGVLRGMAEFELRSKAALGVYADSASKKLEATAKKDAIWIDRSGISRKTIKGGFQWRNSNQCDIYVAGNTEYFPYLELTKDKHYAVLKPTVDKLSPQILRGLSSLTRR